jgi:hypothetical protein
MEKGEECIDLVRMIDALDHYNIKTENDYCPKCIEDEKNNGKP